VCVCVKISSKLAQHCWLAQTAVRQFVPDCWTSCIRGACYGHRKYSDAVIWSAVAQPSRCKYLSIEVCGCGQMMLDSSQLIAYEDLRCRRAGRLVGYFSVHRNRWLKVHKCNSEFINGKSHRSSDSAMTQWVWDTGNHFGASTELSMGWVYP